MAPLLAPVSQQVPEMFRGLDPPVGTRCSYGGNYLFPSFIRESQKDDHMKRKLPCLFPLAHGLRNTEHHSNAVEGQVVFLQKLISQTQQDIWAGIDKTLGTACVRSLHMTVEKLEGHMAPVVIVPAQEKLDRWLEDAKKRVFETKIHKALYIDQDTWGRNI